MRPLSISLVGVEFRNTGYTATRLLMESLILFSRRWKSINLKVPSLTIMPFTSLAADDVPLLETRTPTERDGTSGERPNREQTPVLHTVPRLHGVSPLNILCRSESLKLPWARLTQLSVKLCSPSQCPSAFEALEMLRQCLNLRGYILIAQPLEFTPPLRRAFSPNLDSIILHITVDRNIDLTPLFENLCAPRLRELEIMGQSDTIAHCMYRFSLGYLVGWKRSLSDTPSPQKLRSSNVTTLFPP